MEVGTGAAGGVAADIINKGLVAPIIRKIDDLINMDTNNQFLQVKLQRMKHLLQDISNDFENQQRVPAQSITYCLGRMRDAIQEATDLSARSQRKQNSLYWLISKASISGQIAELNAKFDQLIHDLYTDFGIFQRAQQIVSAAPLRSSAPLQSPALGQPSASTPPQETDVLLQPVPDGGFVGSEIKSAETRLQAWIDEESLQVRVIAVYGMAGVGKTSILMSVHNFYKVRDVFDVVIWLTVSQEYKISDLQDRIANALKLDFSVISDLDTDTRKMTLSASLRKEKFLLILDDLWSPLNLQEELGVTFGDDKVSKVVFSTRNRDLATMEADKFLKLEPLSIEEGWELFQRVAFKDGHVPEQLKECARDFADECEGLPLAITVVAATMKGKPPVVKDWKNCLSLMKIADRSFPDTHPRVDKQLYRRLRWSYDDLPNSNLKNCFLYCAMYPEDWQIKVDELVQFWMAEDFVKSKIGTYSTDFDLGHRYVKLLIDRGLFQSVNFEKRRMDIIVNKPVDAWKRRLVTVHDVIRDMAIYIAEEEENYFCRGGQKLTEFPESQTQSCQRISLDMNQIESLPKEFICPRLVSLILFKNPLTCNIPETFLINLTSLRVLDLSSSRIQSVPTSLTRLTSLKFLDLNKTDIKELPQEISNLSELRFLNLSYCISITSLPYTIGKLTQLQFLNLRYCESITSLPYTIGKLTQLQCLFLEGCYNLVLPAEISHVTSLKRLTWDIGTSEKALKDPTDAIALKGLTNLKELSLSIFLEFEAHEQIGTWLEMRHLRLSYNNYMNNTLPHGLQNMKKLESLVLNFVIPVSLPNWICEFEQLERLELSNCGKELPSLERLPKLKFLKLTECNELIDLGIGSSQKPGGFPMLETLVLKYMEELRSITCPSCEGGALQEGTLSKLCILKIERCPALTTLPMEMEKLLNKEKGVVKRRWRSKRRGVLKKREVVAKDLKVFVGLV